MQARLIGFRATDDLKLIKVTLQNALDGDVEIVEVPRASNYYDWMLDLEGLVEQ